MKIHIVLAMLALKMMPVIAAPINLQDYFPVGYLSTELITATGAKHSRYSYNSNPDGYMPLYDTYLNQGIPGNLYTWQKDYFSAGKYCTATVAQLWFGSDLSITEVGDWYSAGTCTPSKVFGYHDSTGNPSGIKWAGAGGVDTTATIIENLETLQSNIGSTYRAYSKAGLIEILPSFTLDHGNQQTYDDVVHIVMYHGTKNIAAINKVRCPNSPISANGAYYQSYKDYNSYAIELWLARGQGIIQERTPFIEDGTFWKISNCSGSLFSNDETVWTSYRI